MLSSFRKAVPLQNYPLPIPALPAPRAVPSRSAVAKVWVALPSRYHAEWSHATLCLAMPLHCLTHLCPCFVSLDLAHAVSYGTELCRCYTEPTSPCLALASRHDAPRNLATDEQNPASTCLATATPRLALPLLNSTKLCFAIVSRCGAPLCPRGVKLNLTLPLQCPVVLGFAPAILNSVLPCLGDVSRGDALPSCICVVICLCYA